MNILGIHIGHDSSAALVVDGKIVADVAEERFTRIKHYSGLPTRSINYCLEYANISMDDLTAVAIPEKSDIEMNNLLHLNSKQRIKPTLKREFYDFYSQVIRKSQSELR